MKYIFLSIILNIVLSIHVHARTTGRAGSLVSILSGIREQARQSLLNVKSILEEAGTSLANVVKTTVYLHDMADFAQMNEVYAEFFAQPYPARSAVAVRELPKGALVEIEVVATV